MVKALNSGQESKNDAANLVIQSYKQLLYGAAEFEESAKKIEDIYNEALAIYRLSYDYARSKKSVKYCGFAWRVAGSALSKFYAMNQSEKTEKLILCSRSVLREVLN
ncbi:RNA-directed RNA polymerase [Sarracenia purpurea var. burkii]